MSATDPDLLPWSETAEQSVLGALLNDNTAWDRVADTLTRASFFSSAHGAIFETISVLVNSGKPADVITVFERLQGKAQEVGGLGYLNDLSACVPSAAHVRRYAEIVADKAMRRALLETVDEARGLALGEGETADVVDSCVTKLLTLQQADQRSQVEAMETIIVQRMDHINALSAGEVQPGIPTGLPGLDEAIGGARKGKLIVVAARPGVGKTASALQIAAHCAIVLRESAAVFSMEMEKGELADRCIANEGRISYGNLLSGKLSDAEWSRLAEAVDRLGNAPLHMDDQPALSLHDIRAKASPLVRKGLRLLVIDYVQLCAGSRAAVARRENRNSEIEEITRGLKQMAKEFGITVILLSQLSREVEKRSSPKPTLADLRDSGAIEQDADVVLMLWPIRQEGGNTVVGAYVPKNRQGKPNTEWQMKFQGYWQHFAKYEVETAHRGPGSYDLEPGGFEN